MIFKRCKSLKEYFWSQSSWVNLGSHATPLGSALHSAGGHVMRTASSLSSSPTPRCQANLCGFNGLQRTRFKNVSSVRINSFRGKPVSRHNLNLQFTMWRASVNGKHSPKMGKKFTMSTSLWFCSQKKKSTFMKLQDSYYLLLYISSQNYLSIFFGCARPSLVRGLFSSFGKRGLLLIVVLRLLTEMASLAAEHQL